MVVYVLIAGTVLALALSGAGLWVARREFDRVERQVGGVAAAPAGYVYVISNEGSFGEGLVAIGVVRTPDPRAWVERLGEHAVPFDFDVHAMIYAEDASALEAALHRALEERRVNRASSTKNFFAVDLGTVRAALDALGVRCEFTTKAAARDYRETLALRRASPTGTSPPTRGA